MFCMHGSTLDSIVGLDLDATYLVVFTEKVNQHDRSCGISMKYSLNHDFTNHFQALRGHDLPDNRISSSVW